MNKKYNLFFLFLLILTLDFVNAVVLGNDDAEGVILTLPETSSNFVNYSTVNVNNSQYFQGYTPETYYTWLTNFFLNKSESSPSGNSSSTTYDQELNKNSSVNFNDIEIDNYIKTPYFSSGYYQNLLQQTEAFDSTTWIKVNTTVVANNVISPIETLIAEKLIQNTTNQTYIFQNYTTKSNTTFTFSVWVRPSNNLNATIGLDIIAINSTNALDQRLVNGTYFNINNYSWKRIYITSYINVTHSAVQVRIINGMNNVSIWGAQLENNTIVPRVYSGPLTTSVVISPTSRTTSINNLYSYGTISSAGAISSSAGISGTTCACSSTLTAVTTATLTRSNIMNRTNPGLIITNAQASNSTISQWSPSIFLTGSVNSSTVSTTTDWIITNENYNFNKSILTFRNNINGKGNETIIFSMNKTTVNAINYSCNGLLGITQSYNIYNGTNNCQMNFTGGILTWSSC